MKIQILDDLARQYVEWQNRLDAFEAERAGVYARVLGLQQSVIEGTGTPKALQEGKVELQNLDFKIDAVLAKLDSLWQESEKAVEVEIAARRSADPEIQAALDKEYLNTCALAANLFVKALELTDGLQIDRAAVAKYLGFPESHVIFGYPGKELLDAIDQARRQAPAQGKTYGQKKNELITFMISSSGINKLTYISTIINKAILAMGGRSVIRALGAGDLAHEPRKEHPCKTKF